MMKIDIAACWNRFLRKSGGTLFGAVALVVVGAQAPPSEHDVAPQGEPLGPAAQIGSVSVTPDPEEPDVTRAQQPTEQNDVITVYFATNRNPIPNTTHPDRLGNELRRTALFGQLSVDPHKDFELVHGSIRIENSVGDRLDAPRRLADAAAGRPAEQRGPLEAFSAKAAQPETDVLVYIHGAGHSFESGIAEAARVASLYSRNGVETVLLVFSYPTDGKSTVLGYLADRRDAGMSGLAMAEAFQKLVEFLGTAKFPGDGRVVLAGHSLGVYALREGVQSVAKRKAAGQPPIFSTVLLFAGDEDADAFSRADKLGPLLDLAEEVTVYFAPNDFLMFLSKIANFRTAIGDQGPENVSTADYGDTVVAAVDASEVAYEGDRRGHSYHFRSPSMVSDVRRAFAGLPPGSIPGRIEIAPRVYKVIGNQGLARTSSDPALDRALDERIYVYVEDASGPGRRPLDANDPDQGALISIDPERDRLEPAVASVAMRDGEVLPGRFDAVTVEVPSGLRDSETDIIVQLPPKAYLDAVLARGFEPGGDVPRLAEAFRASEIGELRFAVAPDRIVIVRPEPSLAGKMLDLSIFTGTVVMEGPPAGPFRPAAGFVTLAYDDEGSTSGEVHVGQEIFVIEPVPRPVPTQARGTGGTFARVRQDAPGVPVEHAPYSGPEEAPAQAPSENQEVPAEERTEPLRDGGVEDVPDNRQGGVEQAGRLAHAVATPVVDILVGFTPAAAQGTDLNRAAVGYAQASNAALRISGIDGMVRVVGTVVTTPEVTGSQQQLDLLRGRGDGHFDNLHGEAERLRADGVALITIGNEGRAGRAHSAAGAFLFTGKRYAGATFTLIHEMGHWIGASHGNGHNEPDYNWVSVMKHMRDDRCPLHGAVRYCERDGHFTDPDRRHPRYGFLLGSRSNVSSFRSEWAKVSNFR